MRSAHLTLHHTKPILFACLDPMCADLICKKHAARKTYKMCAPLHSQDMRIAAAFCARATCALQLPSALVRHAHRSSTCATCVLQLHSRDMRTAAALARHAHRSCTRATCAPQLHSRDMRTAAALARHAHRSLLHSLNMRTAAAFCTRATCAPQLHRNTS